MHIFTSLITVIFANTPWDTLILYTEKQACEMLSTFRDVHIEDEESEAQVKS